MLVYHRLLLQSKMRKSWYVPTDGLNTHQGANTLSACDQRRIKSVQRAHDKLFP